VLSKIRFPAIASIATIGLIDALYLTVKHLNGEMVKCTVTSGCDEVLSSSYASIAGIPLSYLGLGAYAAVFSLGVLASFGYSVAARLLPPLIVVMLLMTCWLIYVQAAILEHFCQYCLISAAVTFSIAILVLPPVISGAHSSKSKGLSSASEL
jgi:uncharacterized membrane protein